MWQMWNTFDNRYSLISHLINIIYPSRCPLCEGTSDKFICSPLCKDCWSQIMRYTGPSCRICALPFSSELSSICAQCFKQFPPFSKVINFGIYEGALAEAIHQLKFHGVRRISKPLATLISNLSLPVMDGIVPVPLHIKSLRERGFNQSILISRNLSRSLRIPLFMDTLIKKKETPPQIGLSARERISNIRNAFSVTGDVKDLRILLFDDVMTTGATVRECSHELLNAGAREVIVLTLARSRIA
jgi:ComF family protein